MNPRLRAMSPVGGNGIGDRKAEVKEQTLAEQLIAAQARIADLEAENHSLRSILAAITGTSPAMSPPASPRGLPMNGVPLHHGGGGSPHIMPAAMLPPPPLHSPLHAAPPPILTTRSPRVSNGRPPAVLAPPPQLHVMAHRTSSPRTSVGTPNHGGVAINTNSSPNSTSPATSPPPPISPTPFKQLSPNYTAPH
jgi:hypothetical protein